MLTKLIKYDLKHNAKIQAALIAAMLILIPVSLAAIAIDNGFLISIIQVAAMFSSIGVIIAYAVTQIIYFYNTMVGKESYFTHTLPVTTNKVLLSKYISALLWGIAFIASVCLYWFIFFKSVGFMPDNFGALVKPVALMVVGQVIFAAVTIGLSIAISAHHKVSGRSKALVGVISYLVIYYAGAVLLIALMALVLSFRGELTVFFSNAMSDEKAFDFVNDISFMIFFTYTGLAALLYALMARIFNKSKSI